MKSISAKSTSGPEAILVAVMNWWLDQQKDLEKEVVKAINGDPRRFSAKSEYKLGVELKPYYPVDDTINKFWTFTRKHALAKSIVEQAVLSQKFDTTEEKIKWARDFVSRQLTTRFGEIVKENI